MQMPPAQRADEILARAGFDLVTLPGILFLSGAGFQGRVKGSDLIDRV